MRKVSSNVTRPDEVGTPEVERKDEKQKEPFCNPTTYGVNKDPTL